MMAAGMTSNRLIDRLPVVRGHYAENADLSKVTWFRVGGPAEVLFRPADSDDLAAFLSAKTNDIPVTVIGVASNLLIRDGGIPGVVIRLGDAFTDIAVSGPGITAGAGVSNLKLANAARDAGIAGLEFLSGIPGSVGGGLRMNAGAFGGEIGQILISLTVVNGRGEKIMLSAEEMGYSYRHSEAAEDFVFTEAFFRGTKGDPVKIAGRMKKIQTEREASQPVKTPTGGSTFVNPPGKKAWQLIDQAGCRGLRRGGAMVSEKHCNFLINCGDATATDLEGLGEEVRRRVKKQTGVKLEWEIRCIGIPAGPSAEPVIKEARGDE